MIIATYNANSIRARLPLILDWLSKNRPDILAIQETKTPDQDFPAEEIEKAGYHSIFRGQKSYNGVAILSLEKPEEVIRGLEKDDEETGPRVITARFKNITVTNTYVPQGQSPQSEKFRFKLEFLERLRNFFERNNYLKEDFAWVGDFNIAPSPLDVYDPVALDGEVGFHPEERKSLEKFLALGLKDIYRKHNPDKKEFTFWDYRLRGALKKNLGWRLDHIFASETLAGKSVRAWIDRAPREADKPSDHTFLLAEFNI